MVDCAEPGRPSGFVRWTHDGVFQVGDHRFDMPLLGRGGQVTPDDADPPADTDIACKQFVELITDYLDDVLPDDVRADVDEHLTTCDGCQNVLAQWHTIITLTEADVDNTDDRLNSTLRGLRRR
jgi:hypothetical protein